MSSTEKQETTGDVTSHSRIARYDQYFDLRTFCDTLRKTSKPAVKKHGNKKPVLLVRRIIDSKGQHSSTKIDIKSPALCNVLLEINRGVEGLKLTRNPPVADPMLFFHSHAALKAKFEEEQSKESQDAALIVDLAAALQLIQEDHGINIADFERLVSYGEITYDLLWALFTPNTLVHHYHELTEQSQILLVRTVEYSQRQDKSLYLRIYCDIISCDGKSFGMARDSSLEIDAFQGARKIQDLDVFPLKYHTDASAIRDHAVRRGKRFAQMVGHTYHEISGPAMKEVMKEAMNGFEVKRFKFSTYGRVMIDPAAFRTFEPNCTYNLRVHKRLDREQLTDDDFAICTPIVLGFCFGVKMWGGFAMDHLQDIVWSEEAFRSLVLGSKQKILIHSLVKQHTRRAALFDDIVAGKGQGLIGLLSGGPGCGTTLTAEAVAEVTGRPLYVVSAGELGTVVTDVDKNLTKILELSRTWDAVLLLDEAEVFLQKRSTTDINRNALVSIFLRQLEYYQGILFLTTNLIAECDPAFESRIHFSIHYPDLDFESRKAIWKTFFEKTLNQSSERKISDEDIDRLAKHEMNGRQIRNTVSNAQSIALETQSPLSVVHVDAVLEVLSDWNAAKEKMASS